MKVPCAFTELSQKKFVQNTYAKKGSIMEPNIYYKSIYKMVDKTFVEIAIGGYVTILTIISIFFHTRAGGSCGFVPININEKINNANYTNIDSSHVKRQEKSKYGTKQMQDMFMIPIVIGIIFIIVNSIIIIIFSFTKIKDDQRLGIKFDCYSNAIIHIIAEIFYFILKRDYGKDTPQYIQDLRVLTKDGIYIFVICGIYLHFTSVIIPLIKCFKAERLDKKYANEPTNTMQYFYKILNSPNLVEELKAIAIQDFVVENVLFWENYCILQKLVIRAKQKQEIIGESSSSSHHQKFSLQDITTSNSGSHDEESYDPNYPLLPQLVPYYNAFYHT
ncbi:hypothetical protein PIROE2DRAFT_5012 [Piromyces sp. E2]|nr:hypothetical protein PIROE2DRAFT_5012 [Piromyces sp. E2]|eukprot:OUM67489.1 hypothetical protein PIROE2DRAFT_5012 [Piromyces sp. E2]